MGGNNPASIWDAPLLFPYGVALLYHDSWRAGLDTTIQAMIYYRLHDHVNIPCPVVSPPNREKPGVHGTSRLRVGMGTRRLYPPIGRREPPRENFALQHRHRRWLKNSFVIMQRSRTPDHTIPRIARGYFPDVNLPRGEPQAPSA